MQIGTCLWEGAQHLVRRDGDVLTVLDRSAGDNLRQVLDEGRLASLATAPGAPVHAAALTFLPPITDPDKIICVGLNYRGHLAETGTALPDYPSVFPRFASSQVGHGQAVIVPTVSSQLDYEAELAVVIGRRAHRVKAGDAMDYIAGYTCFAENSVRDYQMHARQVTAGKNFLSSGAIGPWLTTADAVADPADLEIIGRLNGEVVQHAFLSQLIFGVSALIAYITEFTELLPGDIISTGTPDGVGFLREPKIWLRPGDVFEVEVPGVGLLRNPVMAERV